MFHLDPRRLRRSRGPYGMLLVLAVLAVAVAMTGTGTAALSSARSAPKLTVRTSTSTVRGSDGTTYFATNHLVTNYYRPDQEYLLAWAGSVNPAEPDFLAVINAIKDSPDYGKVVNTVTVGPGLQNEPHHVQYIWHKGEMIYAGGLFSDTIFVFNPSHLPELTLNGINLPQDTPCGTVPDAFQVLPDGTAYGTEMGGPNVSGPCTYTDGQVRDGNGFGGSPGEVVHVSATGKTLGEFPAATAAGEDPNNCHDIPALPQATCANPHGIAIRVDLHRMVTSDFAEIRNYLNPTAVVTDPFLLRDTVRIWDISNQNDPKLVSVSTLPVGPRPASDPPQFDTDRMFMENSVTNLPHHRGAFASSMAGGAIYYTPDITLPHPVWKEVFDDTTAYNTFDPNGPLSGSNDGGSWLAVSPNDKYLFHAVMGSDPRVPRADDTGMVFVLNIKKLLASGEHPQCDITTIAQGITGGVQPDCPTLTGPPVPLQDKVSPGLGVGPHWGAMNIFKRNPSGLYHETTNITQVATADYFVASTGIDGDHRVCMINISPTGVPSLDTTFRDEVTGQPCVDFNRADWPQGATGPARPHGVLFVVPDRDIIGPGIRHQ